MCGFHDDSGKEDFQLAFACLVILLCLAGYANYVETNIKRRCMMNGGIYQKDSSQKSTCINPQTNELMAL